MKTEITPFGIVLKIKHEGKSYLGIIQNDFERFKTFGNSDLSVDSLIVLDDEFNKLPFNGEDHEKTCELYDLFEELIKKIVIGQNDDDDDDFIDPAGGHGIHSHI